jgi:hypothetical protein
VQDTTTHSPWRGPSSSSRQNHAAAQVDKAQRAPVVSHSNLLCCYSQDTTKNYAPQEAAEQLQQLLRLPWSSGSLQTLTATTNIQISRKGKALLQTQLNPAAAGAAGNGVSAAGLSTSSSSSSSSSSSRGLAPAAAAAAAGDGASGGLISLQHDRAKALPINGSIPDPFLQRIGLQTADGRIKASMQVGLV